MTPHVSLPESQLEPGCHLRIACTLLPAIILSTKLNGRFAWKEITRLARTQQPAAIQAEPRV
jgi:hypothetical protein